MLQYCQLFGKEVIGTLIHTYRSLGLTKHNEQIYAESLLAMITITQTKEGQKLLAEAMVHPTTSHSAMLHTVHLDTPTLQVVDTLGEIYSKFKDHEDLSMRVLAHNAYLLMAGTASKLEKEEHGLNVVRAITMNMENSKDSHEWNLHLRALKNGRDATPLGVYEAILNHDEMPTETKILAVKALGKRTAEHTNKETTNLIHSILEDDHNVLIKTEAVRSQIEREKEIQDSASILEFAKHLEDPDTPDAVVHAIHDYYKEEGTDTYYYMISNMQENMDMISIEF